MSRLELQMNELIWGSKEWSRYRPICWATLQIWWVAVCHLQQCIFKTCSILWMLLVLTLMIMCRTKMKTDFFMIQLHGFASDSPGGIKTGVYENVNGFVGRTLIFWPFLWPLIFWSLTMAATATVELVDFVGVVMMERWLCRRLWCWSSSTSDYGCYDCWLHFVKWQTAFRSIDLPPYFHRIIHLYGSFFSGQNAEDEWTYVYLSTSG